MVWRQVARLGVRSSKFSDVIGVVMSRHTRTSSQKGTRCAPPIPETGWRLRDGNDGKKLKEAAYRREFKETTQNLALPDF
ncbi:hypothetical protein JZ751_012884 [Albula glossodonta]|uniref:Uncharacterized protein n=1 Tax=Albula glossodonta TaxID=121402 RepID=A0A8T2N9W9_9TELE|nr:hypothetical protein JZ751_012884 [Albula glossodonta]